MMGGGQRVAFGTEDPGRVGCPSTITLQQVPEVPTGSDEAQKEQPVVPVKYIPVDPPIVLAIDWPFLSHEAGKTGSPSPNEFTTMLNRMFPALRKSPLFFADWNCTGSSVARFAFSNNRGKPVDVICFTPHSELDYDPEDDEEAISALIDNPAVWLSYAMTSGVVRNVTVVRPDSAKGYGTPSQAPKALLAFGSRVTTVDWRTWTRSPSPMQKAEMTFVARNSERAQARHDEAFNKFVCSIPASLRSCVVCKPSLVRGSKGEMDVCKPRTTGSAASSFPGS